MRGACNGGVGSHVDGDMGRFLDVYLLYGKLSDIYLHSVVIPPRVRHNENIPLVQLRFSRFIIDVPFVPNSGSPSLKSGP